MKKLTNLELSELAIMVGRMLRQIEEFIHVSNLMDQKLKLELEKYYEQLCSEMDKREI